MTPANVHTDKSLLEVSDGLPLELVRIPGGTFLMGSPADEPGRSDSEGPPHAVTVPSFLMGRYPVTQAQWRAVAQMPKVRRPLDPDPSEFKGANRPVESVSWFEAVEFCDRLARQTKRPYRLPTEAEWEYACRAGTTTPFHFGETVPLAVPTVDGPPGESREETRAVGHFGMPHAFGLSDMPGNVWEWCQDPWHDSYDGAPEEGRVWRSAADDGEERVIRGGSWAFLPRACRSAYRDDYCPDNRYDRIGFRVVCDVD